MAFTNPGYRRLWAASLLANSSRMMQRILLIWLVLDLGGSPLQVALIGIFGMSPMLIVGMFSGFFADRFNRQRLMGITLSAECITAIIMLSLLALGTINYWHTYLAALVTGSIWALEFPARRSLIFDLLGSSGITNGMALDAGSMNASKMAGPILGGVLIAMVSVTGGYLCIAIFHAIAALIIWSTKLPQTKTLTSSDGPVLRNVYEGLRYVLGNKPILAVVLITVIMNMLAFPYIQMIPVIARDVLNVGPELMGLLMAGHGIGAVLGTGIIASTTTSHHGRIYLGGSLLALTCLILFTFSRSYFISLPILILSGFGFAGFAVMQSTITLLVSKTDMRGRALGIISLAIGSGPFGMILLGWLATSHSPTFAIFVNASLGLIMICLIGILMPSLVKKIQQRT